jgi:hypothetical protein
MISLRDRGRSDVVRDRRYHRRQTTGFDPLIGRAGSMKGVAVFGNAGGEDHRCAQFEIAGAANAAVANWNKSAKLSQ